MTNQRQLNIVIQAIDRTQGVFTRVGSRLQALGAQIQRMFIYIGTAAVAGFIGYVVQAGFAFDAFREKMEKAFTSLLHSRGAATGFLQDLFAWTRTTTFGFEQVAQSAQELLARGFSLREIIPTLQVVGDTVAALGANPERLDRITYALGQIGQSARLDARDMRQLTEAGVKAWDYLAARITDSGELMKTAQDHANEMGISVEQYAALQGKTIEELNEGIGVSIARARELASEGAISGQEALQAILLGMKEFSGALEAQAETTAGAWQIALRNLRETAGAFTQGFYEDMGKLLVDFNAAASSGDLQETAAEWGATASAIVRSFVTGIGKVIELIKQFESVAIAVAIRVGVAWGASNPFAASLIAITALITAIGILSADVESLPEPLLKVRLVLLELGLVAARVFEAIGNVIMILISGPIDLLVIAINGVIQTLNLLIGGLNEAVKLSNSILGTNFGTINPVGEVDFSGRDARSLFRDSIQDQVIGPLERSIASTMDAFTALKERGAAESFVEGVRSVVDLVAYAQALGTGGFPQEGDGGELDTKWADMLKSALMDGVIEFSEALELEIDGAAAGVYEANHLIEQSYLRGVKAAYEYEKTITFVTTAFLHSTEMGQQALSEIGRRTSDLLNSAFGELFSRPTQEQAGRSAQLALLDVFDARDALNQARREAGLVTDPGAKDPGVELMRSMRPVIEAQQSMADAEQALLQARMEAADITLLSAQDQRKAAEELIEKMVALGNAIGGEVDLPGSFYDAASAADAVTAALHALAGRVSDIPEYHTGGHVPEDQLAFLKRGETVLPPGSSGYAYAFTRNSTSNMVFGNVYYGSGAWGRRKRLPAGSMPDYSGGLY